MSREVNREFGTVTFTCDCCGGVEILELSPGADASEAAQDLKELGWRIEFVDEDDFEHYCPVCRED